MKSSEPRNNNGCLKKTVEQELFVSQFLPKSKDITKIKSIKEDYLNAISDFKKAQNTQVSKFQDSVV